ncbi:hypothetical protein [Alterisphingorhabdus coralli]|uniref:Uncharacterized protein n=1 Tax=Alterisphingorhabdus coralli TaxID=3071408 RepID=A0AA97FBG1_9SPHN|nr:hypothetical protein [Parasphingorhabdus sp. SCSIO 66989]WOE76718.1 hypothetical protein RB602_15140 [Parasphingorhabdus sp. SCSIO 66989]
MDFFNFDHLEDHVGDASKDILINIPAELSYEQWQSQKSRIESLFRDTVEAIVKSSMVVVSMSETTEPVVSVYIPSGDSGGYWRIEQPFNKELFKYAECLDLAKAAIAAFEDGKITDLEKFVGKDAI